MNRYTDYLNMSRHITLEDMHLIHLQMDRVLVDDCSKELYNDLVEIATKYMEHRMNWLMYDREKKMEQDSYRSSCHNTLLVRLNVFDRYIKSIGEETPWKELLKHPFEDEYDRKKVGDFACYIAFMNALAAR